MSNLCLAKTSFFRRLEQKLQVGAARLFQRLTAVDKRDNGRNLVCAIVKATYFISFLFPKTFKMRSESREANICQSQEKSITRLRGFFCLTHGQEICRAFIECLEFGASDPLASGFPGLTLSLFFVAAWRLWRG